MSHFRKDINGLRAIAVIAVVLFHFNTSWLPGGYAGVDVFFVISGFLMTGIICRDLENKKFSILKFYISRANRIVPALAVLCFVLLIFGWFYLSPFEFKTLGKHIISSIGFFSNVVYFNESGYFDASSYEKWLLHTWSLSTEWQFYIVYPLILSALYKVTTLNKIKKVIMTFTIIGFVFCAITTYQWPNSSYYLLPTRAWEMMFGGVAYFYPFTLNNKKRKMMEWLGVSLIIFSYLVMSEKNYWPGYLALIPALGVFLVLQAERNTSIITGNIVFQNIGKWSYSIYLWHWPLVVIIYYYSLSEVYIYIGIVLSICLGFLSYQYIERIKFATEFKSISSYRKCKQAHIIITVGFLGGAIFITNGVNSSLRPFSKSEEAKYILKYQKDSYIPLIEKPYREECNFFDRTTHLAKNNNISESCINNGMGGIFIWGDSHAQALSYGIRNAFPGVNINQVASSGCRPLIKKDTKTKGEGKISCDRSNQAAKMYILKIKPQVILLAQRYQHSENDFNDILSYVELNGLQSKVILIGPIPKWEPSLPQTIIKRHFNKNNKIIDDSSFVNETLIDNDYLRNKYKIGNLKYLSITDSLCNNEGCLAKVDEENTPLVWDYGHLTLEGSNYIATHILKNKLQKYL